jgi:hypothetical protein
MNQRSKIWVPALTCIVSHGILTIRNRADVVLVGTVALLLLLTSCGTFWPECRDAFTIYRGPVYRQPEARINTQGIYVEDSGTQVLYFFQNGLAQSTFSPTVRGHEFRLDPLRHLKSYFNDYGFKCYKEDWGHFTVVGDSIVIQIFSRNLINYCIRTVLEYRGKILNDSAVLISSMYSYVDAATLDSSRSIFRFYLTNLKPDSSCAWFNDKKWYRRNLHPSRKYRAD